MSHFLVYVITGQKPGTAEVGRLLAPYDENLPGNQQAKWDWYQIGGRWSGALTPDYDPAQDPANVEVCPICHGSGQRDDELGREARRDNPDYTCNGCDGKGRAVKWPTAWRQVDGNQRQIKDIDWTRVKPSFAVVKDGHWAEKGRMGMFGVVDGEADDWPQTFKALVASVLPEHWVTVVDCHV